MTLRSPYPYCLALTSLLAACGGDEPSAVTAATVDSNDVPTTAPSPTTGSASTSDATSGPTSDPTSDPTTGGPTTVATTDSPTSDVTATTLPAPSCGDGKLDDGEECDDGNDLDTDACTSQCKAPTCSDGLQSGDESDLDCGGSCPGCGPGGACVDDDDCAGGLCAGDVCSAPCPAWSRQWGSMNTDIGRGIAVDAADHIIVSGSVGPDGSVRMLDASGNEQWSDVLDSGQIDLVHKAAFDGAGNALIVGLTKGGLEGNTLIGHDDAFVVKYAPDGALLWLRQFGTISDDRGIGVAASASGDVFVVGSTYNALDGNVWAGSEDLFLTKFDAQGVKLWTRQLGTSTYDSAWDVALGPDGSIAVVGASSGKFDGNASAGDQDGILVKFDANGAKLWSRQFGTAMSDIAVAVDVDAKGAVVVAANVAGALDGNTWVGETDLALLKFDAAGMKQWTRQLGSPMTDSARGLVLDANGVAYVSGQTNAPLDGNALIGARDIFLTAHDAAGTKLWTQQFGSPELDDGGSVARLGSGALVVVGNTLGALDGPQQGGGDIVVLLRCAP